MTVVAFVTNCIAYYLLKSMYSFAFATLLTALLWYIVCEILTKELRADIRENIAFALMVSMYLVCGLKMNAIIGCICIWSYFDFFNERYINGDYKRN